MTEKGSARTKSTSRKDPVGTFGAFEQKFFEVDHPFIFMVWDYYSGMFLLMGRVIHPDVIPT